MTIEVKDTGPLTWNVPIVNVRTGHPSPEFQRRWEQQRRNNSLINSITLGSGPPTGTPDDGVEYVDTSTTPYTLYVGKAGAWHQVGVVKFTDLSDAPHTYAGKANDLVIVNSTEDGVEFLGGFQGDVLYNTGTGWAILAPGADGEVLTTHGSGADPTWASAGDLGFGFNATGLLAAGELLGAGIIPHNTTFDDTNTTTQVICAIPATASASCPLWTTDSLGVLYSPGAVHFAAGASTGTLQLSPNPWLYLGRHPIYLYAPNPADTTLSEIMGFIVGTQT